MIENNCINRFEQLPDDILIKISSMSGKQENGQLFLVSKLINQLLNDVDCFWRHLCQLEESQPWRKAKKLEGKTWKQFYIEDVDLTQYQRGGEEIIVISSKEKRTFQDDIPILVNPKKVRIIDCKRLINKKILHLTNFEKIIPDIELKQRHWEAIQLNNDELIGNIDYKNLCFRGDWVFDITFEELFSDEEWFSDFKEKIQKKVHFT